MSDIIEKLIIIVCIIIFILLIGFLLYNLYQYLHKNNPEINLNSQLYQKKENKEVLENKEEVLTKDINKDEISILSFFKMQFEVLITVILVSLFWLIISILIQTLLLSLIKIIFNNESEIVFALVSILKNNNIVASFSLVGIIYNLVMIRDLSKKD
ncbi:hypothetical protein [Mycoplasma sp. P36-A1]|uniref:hypothetical protein n=1 Tax=Mycoplasma sp. P36-A1 TaxID=3252900 RepID=UPI003C2F6916